MTRTTQIASALSLQDVAAARALVLGEFAAACAPALGTAAAADLRTEVLPTRQCRAAAEVLGVDAVAISVVVGERHRVLLGASAEDVAVVESLEFTVGEGPCMTAHADNRPVLVPDLTDVSAPVWDTWPQYAHEVLARTPYRAVFAFPLSCAGLSLGTVVLLRREAGEVTAAEVAAMSAVAERIFEDLVESGMFDDDAPREQRWSQMPLAATRTVLWQAIGIVSVELSLSCEDSLALLRAAAFAQARLLDEVAADVVARRLFLDATDD